MGNEQFKNDYTVHNTGGPAANRTERHLHETRRNNEIKREKNRISSLETEHGRQAGMRTATI